MGKTLTKQIKTCQQNNIQVKEKLAFRRINVVLTCDTHSSRNRYTCGMIKALKADKNIQYNKYNDIYIFNFTDNGSDIQMVMHTNYTYYSQKIYKWPTVIYIDVCYDNIISEIYPVSISDFALNWINDTLNYNVKLTHTAIFCPLDNNHDKIIYLLFLRKIATCYFYFLPREIIFIIVKLIHVNHSKLQELFTKMIKTNKFEKHTFYIEQPTFTKFFPIMIEEMERHYLSDDDII